MFVVIVKFSSFDKKIFGLFKSSFDASNWAFSQKWINEVSWSIELVNFVKQGEV